MNTLGENLKKYRIKMKLTQEDIAKKINKTRETYSRYETGTLKPDIDTLIELADIFQVSLDLLTGRTTTAETYIASFFPGWAAGDLIGAAVNRKRVTKKMKREAKADS